MERAGEKSDGDVDDDDYGDDGAVDADDVDDAGEKSDGDVDDDGDGCGEVGFRNFYQYSRHLLGPGDDSVEDFNMKWVTLE